MRPAKNSPFLHAIRLNDGLALFHSLTLQAAFLPERPRSPALGDLPACLSGGFPAPGDEPVILERLRRRASESPVVMGCLFLGFACDSSCRYCFLQPTRGPARSMDAREVRHAVADFSRRVLSSGRDAADLLLFGGEPFLHPDLVGAALDAIPSRPRLNVSISTCGSGVEPLLARRLASAGAFPIVSMDGPPEIHDRARPRRGESSFAVAERAFHILREAGCRVGISMTLTRWNIERAGESFGWLLDRFRPDDIGLNSWLHPAPGRNRAPGQLGWRRSLGAVTSCLDRALGEGVYVEQMWRRIRPMALSTPRLRDCTSPGGRMVYVPGGARGQCDCMSAAGLGLCPADADGPSEPCIPASFSPVGVEACLGCPAVCLCGGGCRWDAYCATGSFEGIQEARCRFERGLLTWMLQRLHGICGSPGAHGLSHIPSRDERLLLAGGLDPAGRASAPMPEATAISEIRG